MIDRNQRDEEGRLHISLFTLRSDIKRLTGRFQNHADLARSGVIRTLGDLKNLHERIQRVSDVLAQWSDAGASKIVVPVEQSDEVGRVYEIIDKIDEAVAGKKVTEIEPGAYLIGVPDTPER